MASTVYWIKYVRDAGDEALAMTTLKDFSVFSFNRRVTVIAPSGYQQEVFAATGDALVVKRKM